MAGEDCAQDIPADVLKLIETTLGFVIPRTSVCPHHQAPMDYLQAAWRGEDVVVWAPRGGGKTTLGALATFLDLTQRPGCQVRILGGSLQQSLKMWEQLLPMLERGAAEQIDGKLGAMHVDLRNGSSAAVLTQSQRSVRGNRVQRIRCDEVELFDRGVWEAAQLVTRSLTPKDAQRITDDPANHVRASIEALSTLHEPYGLMQDIVDTAAAAGRKVIRWCLLDVLEPCPETRKCEECALRPECNGIAKEKAHGFFRIDDAIAMKKRVSKQTWEAEMLCLRPSRQNTVFHQFQPQTHVSEQGWWRGDDYGIQRALAIDFGYRDPFVCLWILHDQQGRVFVLDELVSRQQTVAGNIALINQRGHLGFNRVACDPAGNGTNSQTARSDVDVLSNAGFEVWTRGTKIADGVDAISTALAPADGAPTLRIHPRCGELIRSMERYHYGSDGKPVKDGNDHCTDALRYFYVNRPTPTRSTRY